MNFDLRLPIGILFSLFGAILVAYGLMTNGDAMYAKSLGDNINLWWGLVLVAFGGFMLFLATRAKNKAD